MKSKVSKKQQRIYTLNGCYYTPINVTPSNWNEPGTKKNPAADPLKEWRVWYRFYDPSQKNNPKYPGGVRLVSYRVPAHYTTLTGKREAVEEIISYEKMMLSGGYNYITDSPMAAGEVQTGPNIEDPTISPDSPFIKALSVAVEQKVCVPQTRADMKSVLKYVKQACLILNYTDIPLNTIGKGHMKMILNQVSDIKNSLKPGTWTRRTHIYYRAGLQMMYEVLEDWGAASECPLPKLPKNTEGKKKKKRLVLTDDECILIDRVLKRDNYFFWRFLMIFHKAGCRRTEIMTVQRKHVNLEEQYFDALRKKGKEYTWVRYPITNQALWLWRELLEGCGPEDFIFSRGLVPGKESIRAEQTTRRYKKWVKERFGVLADMYSFKHKMSTYISQIMGTAMAAHFNNESEKMIKLHYDTDYDERMHKLLIKIHQDFIPTEQANKVK